MVSVEAQGAGIDIIAVSRMRQILENPGCEAFLRKVYTADELMCSKARADSVPFLARTFAAKEAIFKTFGIAGSEKVQLSDIEIHEGEFGQPVPVLSGYFAELARERHIEDVLLSVAYDGDYAVAMAVLRRRAMPCKKGSMSKQTKYFRHKNQSSRFERGAPDGGQL